MTITASWESVVALWETIRPWLPMALSMLLPKLYQYYKSYRNKPVSAIRPLPTKAFYALWALCLTGLVALISTLPLFSPENIFVKANAYPHTTGTVLSVMLKSRGHEVTPKDEKTCQILNESKQYAFRLYARYGPDVLLNNPLSLPDEIDAGRWYLVYAAPSILTPHLLHLLALGITTSGFFSGRDGARWRYTAVLLALGLAAVEMYVAASYDPFANSIAAGVQKDQVQYLHWKIRVWRGFAIAGLDAVLAWMIWLQATGRAFVTPSTPIERVADHAKHLESLVQMVGAATVVHNGTMRDAVLRRKVEDYWLKEEHAMADFLEQPEVVQAQRSVLAKTDMRVVERDIGQYVDGIIRGVSVPGASGNAVS